MWLQNYNTDMNPELVVEIIERGRKVEVEPKQPFIVAVEGPVCAGKSSLTDNLALSGIGTIQEYSEYVAHANQDFPKFPPKDSDGAKNNFEFFLNLEGCRDQDLALLTQSQIAIDRSIYTLLAFEMGATAITGIDIFDWAVCRLQKEKGLILPDHVFYLDVPPEISRQRAEANNIPIPKFLLSDEFNHGFREFFFRLSKMYPDYVTILPAEKPLDEVVASFQTNLSSLVEQGQN